jgi:hypothetical protein
MSIIGLINFFRKLGIKREVFVMAGREWPVDEFIGFSDQYVSGLLSADGASPEQISIALSAINRLRIQRADADTLIDQYFSEGSDRSLGTRRGIIQELKTPGQLNKVIMYGAAELDPQDPASAIALLSEINDFEDLKLVTEALSVNHAEYLRGDLELMREEKRQINENAFKILIISIAYAHRIDSHKRLALLLHNFSPAKNPMVKLILDEAIALILNEMAQGSDGKGVGDESQR